MHGTSFGEEDFSKVCIKFPMLKLSMAIILQKKVAPPFEQT